MQFAHAVPRRACRPTGSRSGPSTAPFRPSWCWRATASRSSSATTTSCRRTAPQNGGFGGNTISTHEHNGHHGAENDGFTGAFFFPGQFYDYHWPIVLAGFRTINTGATDPRAGAPDGSGGITKVPGDWHETMSTHWFHDHMFSFTSQNVYKGNAAMFNIYSALDRGNEGINDGVNLRLPSGTAKDWGNLDYDVNLMLADKAWDPDGQLLSTSSTSTASSAT